MSPTETIEQRRQEDSRAWLAALVESSDDAILSKDLTGTIVSWNKSAERLFGYTAEEALGRAVTIIIPPALHPEEKQFLAEVAAGRTVRRPRRDDTPAQERDPDSGFAGAGSSEG